MEKFTVKRHDGPAYRFTGELLAEVESSFNNASPDYSGSTGRRQVARLYRTAKGKLVCQVEHLTCWQGERDYMEAWVTSDLTKAYQGFLEEVPSWLAEELFDGLDAVEEID